MHGRVELQPGYKQIEQARFSSICIICVALNMLSPIEILLADYFWLYLR